MDAGPVEMKARDSVSGENFRGLRSSAPLRSGRIEVIACGSSCVD